MFIGLRVVFLEMRFRCVWVMFRNLSLKCFLGDFGVWFGFEDF